MSGITRSHGFKGLPICFSKWLCHFYIPASNKWGFKILKFLINMYSIYYYSHPGGCEIVSHNDFDLYFSHLSIFSCTYCLLKYILKRNVYLNSLSILKIRLSFIIELQEYFIYDRYKSLMRYMIHNFFLFCGSCFHFLGSSLLFFIIKNTIYYYEVHVIIIFFIFSLVLWCYI